MNNLREREAFDRLWPKLIERLEILADKDQWYSMECQNCRCRVWNCRRCNQGREEFPFPDAKALLEVAKTLREWGYGRPGTQQAPEAKPDFTGVDVTMLTDDDLRVLAAQD